MKKILVVIALMYSGVLHAQEHVAPTTVFKEWERVIETSDHTEISVRVAKCFGSTANQVHLLLFNEASNDKVVKFKVEITNKADKKTFSKQINSNIAKHQMVFPDCSNDPAFTNFKIDLPGDYNPSDLEIKVTIL